MRAKLDQNSVTLFPWTCLRHLSRAGHASAVRLAGLTGWVLESDSPPLCAPPPPIRHRSSGNPPVLKQSSGTLKRRQAEVVTMHPFRLARDRSRPCLARGSASVCVCAQPRTARCLVGRGSGDGIAKMYALQKRSLAGLRVAPARGRLLLRLHAPGVRGAQRHHHGEEPELASEGLYFVRRLMAVAVYSNHLNASSFMHFARTF